MRCGLHRDSCAVDIGCHRGLFLSRILECAPDGEHLAFEPIQSR
jgi:hypothetical protein